LKAPIRLIREAYPHLLKSPNPKVINIVSLSGLRVKSQDATGYAISKFGLRAVGQAVRQAGWDQKLRVTSIFPGWVNTKMAAGRAPVPDEEMTQPEDIAKLIRLLLELPPTCSMSEIAINCLFEPQT
ncbi:MAG: SDR family NAD(P)-dependent oxidoreductase, partial [Pseudomonadota bacterium]